IAIHNEYNQIMQSVNNIRKSLRYPPYVFLVLLTVSHKNQVKVIQVTQEIVQMLRQDLSDDSTILGPSPSPIARMKDRYRYQCIVKYKKEPGLRTCIRKILKQYRSDMRKDDLMITVDMQPYQLM